jgi:hypothetical protein
MCALQKHGMFENFADEGDAWYARQATGSIVHYDIGFNAYVRCEVTADKHKQLKPIALVGEWRDWDLPHRMADGTINLGYHVQHIQEGDTFHPHASNIFEFRLTKNSGGWHNDDKVDPRNLAPLSLAVPDMKPEEARKAKLVKGIYEIHTIASGNSVVENPSEVLNLIAQKVLETLNHDLAHLSSV